MKNFWKRMAHPLFPQQLVPDIAPQNLIGKIPKFHYDMHGKKDHAQFSFNYTQGAGRVEGEGIERLWSDLKPGVGQTVEMGPGARRDTIDNFCGYSNYRKMTDIGKSCVLLLQAPKLISY